jgi:small GTP-binding protein
VRVVVLGDYSTGKTTLINFYTSPKSEDIFSTVAPVRYRAILDSNGVRQSFEFTDTPGGMGYGNIVDRVLRNQDIVLLIFAIDTPSAFQHLPNWKARIDEFSPKGQIIIVATKADLTQGEIVSNIEIDRYAQSINAPWCAVSAQTGSGMDDLTGALVEKAKAVYLAEKEDIGGLIIDDPRKRGDDKKNTNCCS